MNSYQENIVDKTDGLDRSTLIELLNRCGTPLFVKNRQHEFVYVNDALCELVGFKREEMIGKTDSDLYTSEEASEFVAGDEKVFQTNCSLEREESITDANNATKTIRAIKNILETHNGEKLLVGSLHDLTELRSAQGKLEKAINRLSAAALTDSLTGLSNRTQFEHDIKSFVDSARNEEAIFSVLFIDLNGFKIINDTSGHVIGDEILRIAAGRLRQVLRTEAKIARVGGDEFLVLLPDVGELEAGGIIDRVFEAFENPIGINGVTWNVGLSVGVAVYPKDGLTSCDLIRNADFAMTAAKKQRCVQGELHASTFEFFESGFGQSMARKRRIEFALNFSDSSSMITQSYQPIVRQSKSNEYKVVGFESLARWELEGKSISPDEFIPVLEKSGKIVQFGYQILESACDYISTQGSVDQFVSINLAYKQIVEPGFSEQVERMISRSGVHPRQIALELTEHDANVDLSLAKSVLMKLKKIGVMTMLDDFGSGYSNLSRLVELPIDVVKIDKSVLWKDLTLLKSVMQMVKTLGFTTIVEGVETEAHIRHVGVNGGDMMQGYFFGRPQHETHRWPGSFASPSVGLPADLPIPVSTQNVIS